ncbi:hypothetical protein Vadar_002752 [Vaccinium darrowii]|uniref:Uncharacterized protein n=1 Tax=Vaccinium darrowii TaxID=229202 RepID=A0ACB7WXA6_9ERIC|nr:hypothetical protein Vadar_002752 [Vaccinium darrowii]
MRLMLLQSLVPGVPLHPRVNLSKTRLAKIDKAKDHRIHTSVLFELGTYNQPPPPPPSLENKSWRSFLKYTFVAALTGGVATAGYATDVPAKSVELYLDLRRLTEELVRGFTEPNSDKLLPDFHPKQHVFTLVLDLLETLICSDWKCERGWRTFKRSRVDDFLEHLAQFYEIVVYFDQLIMFVDAVVERLDPKHCIRFRLYRGATKYHYEKFTMASFTGRMREITATVTLLLTFLSYREGGNKGFGGAGKKDGGALGGAEKGKPPLLHHMLFREGVVPAEEEFVAITPGRIEMYDASLWKKMQWIWLHRSKA